MPAVARVVETAGLNAGAREPILGGNAVRVFPLCHTDALSPTLILSVIL